MLTLLPHPATPPSRPIELWVTVELAASFGAMATLNLWFGIGAPMDQFVVPDAVDPQRRDELWTATCFEVFLREEGEVAYREWNFAPSNAWAAYDFESYREGRCDAPVPRPPYIRVEDNLTWWALGATIAIEARREWSLGLAAILEEEDGSKSYWALAHPGDEPDFHDPGCFAARLP